jgi:hypothetical protein
VHSTVFDVGPFSRKDQDERRTLLGQSILQESAFLYSEPLTMLRQGPSNPAFVAPLDSGSQPICQSAFPRSSKKFLYYSSFLSLWNPLFAYSPTPARLSSATTGIHFA